MARTLMIKTQDKTELEIGKKLYVVRTKLGTYASTVLTEKCPLCDDKKKVEMKGYEFACPVCSSMYDRKNRTSIEIKNYAVNEYIVCRADVKGSTVKADYSRNAMSCEYKLPTVKWYAFASWSNSTFDLDTITIDKYELAVGAAERRVDNQKDIYPFYSKSEAEKFCKMLHMDQERKLNAFNKEHGTDHKYPYMY